MAEEIRTLVRAATNGESVDRTHRTVSFLAAPDADDLNKPLLVVLCCLIASTEGMDGALFPSVTKALEELENFDLNNLALLSTAQSLLQAFGGPFWGIVASRAILRRRQILFLGTAIQGGATIIMCFFLQLPILIIMRGFNGFALSSLRPIANSIIGDSFDDNQRGKYFGFVQMSMMLGSAFCGLGVTAIAREEIFSGFYGWKLSFIVVGAFMASLGPLCLFFMNEPIIAPDKTQNVGLSTELNTLKKLMGKPTFAACVIQGCFGLIPWKAFEFRTFFFQTAGLTDAAAGTLNGFGQFAAAAGNSMGGFIGDALNAWWPMHGRVLTAEISIFGGIPIAFFTFMVDPGKDAAFVYFAVLVIGLGIVAAWTPAGANSPILCSISTQNERSLILAWQTSLEGAVGALGPVMFTFLCTNVFGYDSRCMQAEDKMSEEVKKICTARSPDENTKAAGQALFWCSCIPWGICGLIYASLHISYPRDLEKTFQEIQAQEEGAGAGLNDNTVTKSTELSPPQQTPAV